MTYGEKMALMDLAPIVMTIGIATMLAGLAALFAWRRR